MSGVVKLGVLVLRGDARIQDMPFAKFVSDLFEISYNPAAHLVAILRKSHPKDPPYLVPRENVLYMRPWVAEEAAELVGEPDEADAGKVPKGKK